MSVCRVSSDGGVIFEGVIRLGYYHDWGRFDQEHTKGTQIQGYSHMRTTFHKNSMKRWGRMTLSPVVDDHESNKRGMQNIRVGYF